MPDVLRYPTEDPRVVLSGRVEGNYEAGMIPWVCLDWPSGHTCTTFQCLDPVSDGDTVVLRGLFWNKAPGGS